ncbi:MAG TPA: methanol/ethanol family PQQ-dependent dehydrogenase [Gemmatimonadales bacterium]|nr:methanol/ethanol family PQQ-dependent dehydrogenase [Gemmatimonadales bacterium]
MVRGPVRAAARLVHSGRRPLGAGIRLLRGSGATLAAAAGAAALLQAGLHARTARLAAQSPAAAVRATTAAPAGTASPAGPRASASPSRSPGPPPPEPVGEWRRAAGDYANTRFSELDEINASNVGSLVPVWTFSVGVLRGQEAAPLVIGSTMYVTTPYPNILYALDLAKPGGPPKWTYKPEPDAASQGVACCDVVNRGPVFADGKIIFNTLDVQTVAVDAATGREVWRTRLGSIQNGETMTMSPLVVKDRVLVGNSGGEMGVRGWLTALDLKTGRQVWRAYSTGPDQDVLIGPNFKPFYADERGKDLGVRTWPGTAWQRGGGNVWGWISYDPELDLIYYGTANPGPWNPHQRPGDNKWTSTVFARRPETGEAIWAYQFTPHDLHDYDAVNEMVLAEITWKGAPRKVILHPDRNGRLYVLDRATGEVLSAEPFVVVNSSTGVDLRTGRLQVAEDKVPQLNQVTRNICPVAAGGKDWQPSSYSPRTKLLYLPHQNLCMDEEATTANYIAGTPYVGMNVKMTPGPGDHRGEFTAWNPSEAKPAWKVNERFPVWSGALATAGDVVFYGTMEGWFKALDARSGKELWRFKTGSGIIGQPVTYRGPDGKQYVAVMSGVGGWAGSIVAGDLDARDSSAALGFVNAMRDLPQYTAKGGMLYVFALR